MQNQFLYQRTPISCRRNNIGTPIQKSNPKFDKSSRVMQWQRAMGRDHTPFL
jgi:hypothetical protein